MRECKSVSLSERRINSSLLLTSHTIAVGWEDQRVFTRSHMTNGKLSEGMKWSIHETYKNVDWIKRTAPFVKQKKMFVYPCASRVNSSHLSWHSFGALDRHGQHRQAVQTLWEKKREREREESNAFWVASLAEIFQVTTHWGRARMVGEQTSTH